MIEDVSLDRETTLHLAEHEILLSFVNDSGAEKFDSWWFTQGRKLFDKYCEENYEDQE
jgi:hypothetical protein